MTVHVAPLGVTVAPRPLRILPESVRGSYEGLLQRLGWPAAQGEPTLSTLGVTSAGLGAGASTVATQLAAVAAARSDQQVLLVDAHLDAPTQHERFGLPLYPGLVEWLQGSGDAAAPVQQTGVERLSLMTAGKRSGKASRAHDVFELDIAIRELASDYDLVVFDMPPAGRASSSLRLASIVDGVILVVAAGCQKRVVVQRCVEMIRRVRGRLVGTVLNDVRGRRRFA